jgi:hypothetical protein
MPPRLTKVQPLSHCRLFLEFGDGTSGVVDISDRLFGAVFEPLLDSELFNQVTLDEFGAVCWPNGADLAPDALHIQLTSTPPFVSATGTR